MKVTRGFVFTVTVLAIALTASAAPKAKRQAIRLFNDTQVAGTQLKPGEYQMAVEGDVATFYRDGKQVAQTAVQSQAAGRKFDSNSLVYAPDGKSLIEVRLSGASDKLVIGGNVSAGGTAAGRN